MRNYTLTIFFIIFVPFMVSSAVDRVSGQGWSRVWGVLEAVLAVAITAGAVVEVRQGWKRKAGDK
ncbi:hypothetical protein [Streptomyces sp. LaPpAH-108]|uniref:hypothetical protein n=1 Tax=Streptomyces sp. LaPpAH-108 TaxID=1155714 RepID=UPI001319EB57|nr:hypothetical protein [Streptomyces sp. LaPpAH-108]